MQTHSNLTKPAKQAKRAATSAPAATSRDSEADYNYPTHPAANIFPMMSAEEFNGLKKDIAEHGLKTFIALLDDKVIDGRNRLKACKELHVQPDFCEVENCDDPIAYVLSHNLYRRHLSQSQRAQCAAEVAKMRLGDNQHKKSEGSQTCLPSIDDAAKAFSVSPSSVKTAKHVLDKGDKAVVDAVKLGELSVSAARKLVDAVPDKKNQRQLVNEGKKTVAAITKGKPRSGKKAIETEPGKIRGVGIFRASEAIDALKRIPKSDALRFRGYQIVADWIKTNCPEALHGGSTE